MIYTDLSNPKGQRLNAVDYHEILATINEAEFSRITQLASLICQVPFSLVSLIDQKKQLVESVIKYNIKETLRDTAFCRYTVMGSVLLEVEDATKDDRFKNNILVTGDPGVRFFAGYPLIDAEGTVLGTLCVLDTLPKKLTDLQRQTLQLLAGEIIALIAEKSKRVDLNSFEKLFQLSNDLMFVGGNDGYFLKINPAFKKVLGWEEDYVLHTSTLELIHPDDVKSTGNELKKLSEGQPTVNFLQRVKTKWGYYKTIQWTSTPEADTGNIFGIGRDVSELLLKEQLLAASEERLRVFFENSQGLMCTHDLQGKFLSVNQAGAEILGYQPQELIGLSLSDIIPAERHPMLNAYLVQIKETGKAQGQMLTRHKNGSLKVWLYNNTLQVKGDNYIIGNAIDITERYRLEKDLEQTREMLEQTNQVARVGGWEVNMQQQKIYWTSVTKEIHGVTPGYEPVLDTAINFYKEGESRDKIAAVLNKALTEGAPWDDEFQLVDASGKEIWVRVLGNAAFENGVCKRLYGTFQDIDSYKAAEMALKRSIEAQADLNRELVKQVELIREQDKTIEKIKEFKFMADSVPQIIWTSNPDGSMDYYNRHWFDYTGLSLEETRLNGWDTVIHPDDAATDLEAWNASLTSGKPYRSEVRFKRADDGIYKWHLASSLPMTDANGQIIKWFGSCYDIDEYKRALDLENKISQYEDFNRIVAHNLRGPSGSIGMLLNMVQDASDETEKEELLQMLSQSSRTLNETLDDLMKVLEIRTSKNIAYQDCDLQEMVNTTGCMLRGQIITKEVVINTCLEVEQMQFPKMYLESIFYNMVSNSIKYSKPHTAPEIMITSKLTDGRVVLTFSDNGLGIDLHRHGADMFKLSSIFHTGHDSKGIGLFMTKTQIETFGGRITVESTPNVGTTFTIMF